MIDVRDIVIPATGDPVALDACARLVQRHWPEARFEDAFTGEKYSSYGDIPFGHVHELLVYPNAQAEAAWNADSLDSPLNSMLHLILSPRCVTVVLEDPAAANIQPILESIRASLRMDILNTYAEAA
jgi:hypothetical protein